MTNTEILERAAELLRGSVHLSSEKLDTGFRYWREEMREIAAALEAMAAQPQQAPAVAQSAPVQEGYEVGLKDLEEALSGIPCDCPERRIGRGDHLMGCYMFDAYKAYDRLKSMLAAAPKEPK